MFIYQYIILTDVNVYSIGAVSLTWVTPGWVLVVLVYRYGEVPVNRILKTKQL